MSGSNTVSVHVLRRHGHTFAVVTHPSFEAELASRFCEETHEKFATATMNMARVTQSVSSTRPPCFDEQLLAQMQAHSQPERLARFRRVVEVMEAADEVAGVLEEGIDRMLATAQNLDELEDKSEWLLAQAGAFKKSTQQARRLMCWRTFKLWCLVGLFVAAAVTAAVVFLLRYFGVLKLW